MTREFIRDSGFEAPEGKDPRLAIEWERPRPTLRTPFVRPLSIIVPWDEVLERDTAERGNVVWTEPPPDGTCINFDIVYAVSGVAIIGHPGARSMGTKLTGKVGLENGETVFITSVVRPMEAPLRANIEQLRSVRALDAAGDRIENTGMLGFGTEPNPDSDDETSIATLIDVTHPDDA